MLPRYGPLRSVSPCYGPLRSVFASLQTPQKRCFGQVRYLSFLIGCRGRSFNDNMVKNPFNECLHLMISLSLNPNEKLGGKCNLLEHHFKS